MSQPIFSGEVQKTVAYTNPINDTIPGDTLFIHYNLNEAPVMYSRPIITSVCIDGECRLVNIELFWNITGRYLGFELPKGEFLSKTKHAPFNAKEYDRLHNLLGDPLSALANYSMKDLATPNDSTKTKVDAVSSATIAAVLNYIVEGAVYTTYTLWHITYGETKRTIEKLTSQKLNSELVLRILESNNLKDKVWVLNHISDKMKISPELLQKLMETISGKDIYLVERSLNALKPEVLTDDLQLKLATIFENSGFLQKRLIIQKLKETKQLSPEVVQLFSLAMNNMNGTLVKTTLELFKIHKIEVEQVEAQVSELLKNKNRFIANQAYQFLNRAEIIDKRTIKTIEKYKKRN
ncbi:MAG: hypothetical protein HQ522_22195 [Bacteroidetes bacterium]|nr:hypothetical protein [Bacteroidota bacterium]